MLFSLQSRVGTFLLDISDCSVNKMEVKSDSNASLFLCTHQIHNLTTLVCVCGQVVTCSFTVHDTHVSFCHILRQTQLLSRQMHSQDYIPVYGGWAEGFGKSTMSLAAAVKCTCGMEGDV